ncbi:MAG: hypothetical protein KI790_20640, partial [Cyclobacteriaceae bacterium]|nr:hypothetical protein [Cyclobacteriaceae bacterium HetDA_MAG_MS6]
KQVIDYRNNEHIPIAANNSLVVQGYHEELKTFIQLCEGRNAPNRTQASDLLGTYELLSKMT